MKSHVTLITVLMLAAKLALTADAADKPAHLFILSGQSNMALMDPKAGFEPEIAALFPNAEAAHIKVAKGGQAIRYWVAEWDEIAKQDGLDPAKLRARQKNKGIIYYQPILDRFADMLKQHPNPASVTFCWMQGEADANQSLSAPYGNALKQLIANLRRDLKQPNMNFVIGRISDYKTNASWEAVRQAQVTIAESDPHGAWVDCDDLNDNSVVGEDGKRSDGVHYTKVGYETLGRRFARQAKALIEGHKPAANGRPE